MRRVVALPAKASPPAPTPAPKAAPAPAPAPRTPALPAPALPLSTWVDGSMIQGAAVQVPAEVHGFRSAGVTRLAGGATVERWVNTGARAIVLVDEERGDEIPPGAIVLVECGVDVDPALVERAERVATEKGAAKVVVLPARVRGVGERGPLPMIREADPTVREAVEIALQRVPLDVRDGARVFTDQFLSKEKL